MTDSALNFSVTSCCAGFYELPVVSMLPGDNLHPGGPALTRKLAEVTTVGRETAVLDVACGRGESGRVVASHYGCRVLGVDFSCTNMVRAQELTREAGLDDRVRFVVGDAEHLPVDDGSFDVVLAECSLCTFPDLEQSLAEVRRVLRPRGRVGISDVVLNAPVPESLQDVIGQVLCVTGAKSMHGYRRALHAAGFNAIRSYDASYVIMEMMDRIERRLGTLDDLVAYDQLNEVTGLRDAGPRLDDTRRFVASGGVGYAMFTARNPRDAAA